MGSDSQLAVHDL